MLIYRGIAGQIKKSPDGRCEDCHISSFQDRVRRRSRGIREAVAHMGVDDTAPAAVVSPGGGNDFDFTHGMQDLSPKNI